MDPERPLARDPGLTSRVGRDGLLRLRFERRGPGTVVAGCRAVPPLQMLAPMALDAPAAVVFVLNPTGGVVGGDRLVIEVEAGPDAHACLTTPSATRVYRTEGEPAVQEVSLRLAPGAVVEWVPDHTIPFAGSGFRQSIRAEVGDGARLILVDAFAAGRIARGEAWGFGRLESALLVGDARGPLLHDRFRLEGGEAWAGLGFTEGRPYFATVVVVADAGLAELQEAVAEAGRGRTEVVLGIGALPRRGAVVRCLAASAPALGEALEVVWAAARRTVLGSPALALRKA